MAVVIKNSELPINDSKEYNLTNNYRPNKYQRDVWADTRFSYSSKKIDQLKSILGETLLKNTSLSVEHYSLLQLFDEVYPSQNQVINLSQFMTDIEKHSAWLNQYCLKEEVVQHCTQSSIKPGYANLVVNARVQALGENSEESLVLNGVYEYPIWQVSRYSVGNEENEIQMRNALLQWRHTIEAKLEARVIGLSKCGECNSLQDHQGILDEYLEGFVHKRNRGESKSIPPSTLYVKKHSEHEKLELVDSQGKQVYLLNVGGIVPNKNWGLQFWLPYISSPLSIKRPTKGFDMAQTQKEFMHQPRVVNRECILFRETWNFYAQKLHNEIYLHPENLNKIDATLFKKVKAVFLKYKIPKQFFIKKIFTTDWRSINSLSDRHRKPQWIDISNPCSLVLLRRILQESYYVQIQEVLPRSTDQLKTKNDDSYVTEIHFEMILSP